MLEKLEQTYRIFILYGCYDWEKLEAQALPTSFGSTLRRKVIQDATKKMVALTAEKLKKLDFRFHNNLWNLLKV